MFALGWYGYGPPLFALRHGSGEHTPGNVVRDCSVYVHLAMNFEGSRTLVSKQPRGFLHAIVYCLWL